MVSGEQHTLCSCTQREWVVLLEGTGVTDEDTRKHNLAAGVRPSPSTSASLWNGPCAPGPAQPSLAQTSSLGGFGDNAKGPLFLPCQERGDAAAPGGLPRRVLDARATVREGDSHWL